jgi:hypothetical protein
MRGSRQRRPRPEGYPYHEDVAGSPLGRGLAIQTRSERLFLFWTTPLVLWYVDKIICVAFILMFSIWFVAHRQASGSGDHQLVHILGFKLSSNLDMEPLQGVELAMCIYFASSTIREWTELGCELGTANQWSKKANVIVGYCSSLWTVLDMGEIIAFCAGIGYRVDLRPYYLSLYNSPSGSGSGSDEYQGDEYQGEDWTHWSMAYGICLSIAWFRVLRSGDALP